MIILFKLILYGLSTILWGVSLFYVVAGAVFIIYGLYDWSIIVLPIYLFFSVVFISCSLLSTFMARTIVYE